MKPRLSDLDTGCGIGSCRPQSLQCLTNIMTFTLLYSMSGLFTSTNSVYMSSQITTLEKYFGFTSAQTGFLMSCNDIGFLLTTLFISYQARRLHIPRVLSITGIVFGISGVVCSLAYFLSPLIHGPEPDVSLNTTSSFNTFQGGQMCEGFNASLHKCLTKTDKETKIGIPTEYTPIAMTILALGLIVQGVCKSPRQPFVTTYIDDNVDKTQTAFYMGLSFALVIFGPAVAFGVGGLFSKIYVTLQDVDINPTDPRWIGAWWLGFVVFGAFAVVTGIPLLFFPRRLHPRRDTVTLEKQPHNKHTPIRGWFNAVMRLLRNPIYVLCVVSVCIGAFVLSGLSAFMPKYVETQFTLPAWQANVILGVVAILSASFGAFLGGCITSKLKLSPLGCLRFVLLTNILGVVTGVLFYLLGCENSEIIGLNGAPGPANRTCMDTCNCDDKDYFVICGSDGQNYFSPCHAGCTEQINMLYVNCSCIEDGGTALPGMCKPDCPMLYPYIGLLLVTGFLATISAMPFIIFILRSVSDKDKSLAIGISTFLQTLLGFFPGPIVVGKLVDTACVLWTSSCLKVGACALYSNEELRVILSTLIMILKTLILILTIIIYFCSRNKTDWSTDSAFKTGSNEEAMTFLEKKVKMKQNETNRKL